MSIYGIHLKPAANIARRGRYEANVAAAQLFSDDLSAELNRRFGLLTQPYPGPDEIEVYKGAEGMGANWFSLRLRFLSETALFVAMLNVPMAFRSRGIGSFAVNRLKSFARKMGIEYIFLKPYEPAHGFWEKRGFCAIDQDARLADIYKGLAASTMPDTASTHTSVRARKQNAPARDSQSPALGVYGLYDSDPESELL